MPKLLYLGEACASTGFSRVTHSLLDRLFYSENEDWDIHVIGVSYFGDPHPYDYKIYPAIIGGDFLGVGRLRSLAEQIKPDVIVLHSDLWIIHEAAETVKDLGIPIVLYFPVDAESFVVQPELLKPYHLVTYTQFGVDQLRQSGVEQSIDILNLGVDTNTFYPIDRNIAREALGLDPDSFIVLNANTNSPRKRIDLTIKGFREFAANRPNTKLHLHMELMTGWNIVALFEKEAIANGFDPQGRLITSGNINRIKQDGALPSQTLNLIYNAANVMINTSEGEGWGLVAVEGAVCGVPQIVPGHTACRELFYHSETGILIDAESTRSDLQTLREWSEVDQHLVAHAIKTVYECDGQGDVELLVENAYQKFTSPAYSWDAIAWQFEEILLRSIES